jgi:serine/threonine-protein kinase PknG
VSGEACTRTGCGGAFAADGYCNTCGTKQPAPGVSAPAPAPLSSPKRPAQRVPAPAAAGSGCSRLGCSGSTAVDGYCDTCGLRAPVTPAAGDTSGQVSGSTVSGSTVSGSTVSGSTVSGSTVSGAANEPSIAAPRAPTVSTRLGAAAGLSRRTSSRRSGVTRSGLGAGYIEIAATPTGDPAAAVMSDAKIAATIETSPEDERLCRSCDEEVGRGKNDEPGRIRGFCSNCRTPFDFASNAPTLVAGDLVAGQYEVLGPIAHGGMGWIYLGRDKAVSNRWVVLKGLLSSSDADAALAAVAERQFLAQIEHSNIVNIYNFATHGGAGYIVMEYVGGESLNQKLKHRRAENGGVPYPLPVDEAIAYIIGVLPAFGYLHGLGLVYNDLKPANIMAVGTDVKLIDVGAVMRIDDLQAAIFGTQGFQAPEVATAGPSIASDLFTVGRTLAVMVLNFVFHSGRFQYDLPNASEEPLFRQWESLHRFLLKATADHPDDRFQSAEGMADQLTLVLREVVTIHQRTPRPTRSRAFGGDRLTTLLLDDESMQAHAPDWRALPRPLVDADDSASGFLLDLVDLDASQALALLREGVDNGQIDDTREVGLRTVRAYLESKTPVVMTLDRLGTEDPWDWRVDWYRGIERLTAGKPETAAEYFSRVWTEVPGELAPKLAVAYAAEQAGQYTRAAQLYELVVAVDSTYVSAAFGLARCRSAAGDRKGAVRAYGQVPSSSATYQDAQVATARTLAAVGSKIAPAAEELAGAAAAVERLQIDAAERTALTAEILERALSAMNAGQLASAEHITLFDRPLNERQLRLALEETYRLQARLADSSANRVALVDKANSIRPRSFV